MNHDSRIVRYTILFYGKKKKVTRDIDVFSYFIQTHDLQTIRQIIFDFVCPPHFPYSCHNISLCNIGNKFKIQFYHYYNSFNQLVILHPDVQYIDYYRFIKVIQSNTSLTTLLEPYIIPLHFS
jgi:hypothetical protein